jgi:hypothetical protein
VVGPLEQVLAREQGPVQREPIEDGRHAPMMPKHRGVGPARVYVIRRRPDGTDARCAHRSDDCTLGGHGGIGRVRTSLGQLLELADGITLTGVCLDPDGAMRLLEETEVDVVVMDPRLPDFPAGRALAHIIADRWPSIRVVSLNWPDEYLPAAPACVTVAPRTVQPESLLDLLRGSSGSAVQA